MCFPEQKLAVSARKKEIQTPGVFDRPGLAGQVSWKSTGSTSDRRDRETDSLIFAVVSSTELGGRTVIPRTTRLKAIYESRFLRTNSKGYSGLRRYAASGSASTTKAISGRGIRLTSKRT